MEFYKALTQKNSVQMIFQQIKENGPISRRELQEATGLSWGTVSRVVEHLVTQEYIVVAEEKESEGVGPKTEKFDIIMTDRYFIGVDLDNRGFIALVTDMKGRVIESVVHSWTIMTRENVLEKLYQILDGFMARYKDKKIGGIGFAVQGVADVRKGVSTYIGKIEGWNDVPLKALFEERYGVEVVVAHDPDCLMKCETVFGVLRNSQARDVLMVHYNYEYAIGMSIMINGQIYLGHHGRAGEIGYTILGIKEDGSGEMLEQLVGRRENKIAPHLLCDYIGIGVAMANSFFNPEVIVLNTIGCTHQEILFDSIEKRLRNSSWDRTVELKMSNLKYNAKAKGAALIVIESAIDALV